MEYKIIFLFWFWKANNMVLFFVYETLRNIKSALPNNDLVRKSNVEL